MYTKVLKHSSKNGGKHTFMSTYMWQVCHFSMLLFVYWLFSLYMWYKSVIIISQVKMWFSSLSQARKARNCSTLGQNQVYNSPASKAYGLSLKALISSSSRVSYVPGTFSGCTAIQLSVIQINTPSSWHYLLLSQSTSFRSIARCLL